MTHTNHTVRDHVVRAALVASIGLLAWSQFDPTHEDLITHLDDALLCVFLFEVAARLKTEIKARGWGFWRNGWLMFDLLITVLAALPMGADMIAARVVRVAKLAHMGRHVPHLLPWLRYAIGLRAINP
jgi:Ion transport protein